MEIKEQVTHRACEEYLSIKEAFTIFILCNILLYFIVFGILGAIISTINLAVNLKHIELVSQVVAVFVDIIILLVIRAYLKSEKSYNQKHCFKLSYQMIIYIAILALCTVCAVEGSLLFFKEILLPDIPESFWGWPVYPDLTIAEHSKIEKIEIFIRACIIAPIIEEWVYRGYFLKGLSRGYNKVTAILVSSLLFGLMHLNLSQCISGIIGGCILGLLYLRYESLGGCILLHSFYNFLVITESIPQDFYIIGIIVLIVAVYLLWKKIPKKNYCAESTIPIEQIPK